jgi:hypothetical protein
MSAIDGKRKTAASKDTAGGNVVCMVETGQSSSLPETTLKWMHRITTKRARPLG